MNTNYLDNGVKYSINDFDNAINEFAKITEQIESKFINIFLAHPLDLLEMDMKQISTDVMFLSDIDIERGTLMLIKDENIKNTLYQFAKQFPDRVFRGEEE